MKRALFLISMAMLARADGPPKLKPGLYVIFNTSEGNITALLYEKYVPATVANFVALAQGTKRWLDPQTTEMVRRPLYENITFHRVIRDVAIQSGDPTATGAHSCGVKVRDEILPGLRFDAPGRLAMANTGSADSGGCQFFITAAVMPEWNGKYTVFGEVAAGMDVVSKISRAPLRGDKPVDPVKLINVTIERIGEAEKKHPK